MSQAWDVVVIGGGPAGACTASLVAREGFETLLLERSAEAAFKVGESLMPATYWTLDRLGVLEKMKGSSFPRKYSVQFFSPGGKASAPFYFFENDAHESSGTWQVLRRDFDELLLCNAREHGAEVRRGWSVRDVCFDGERAVGVRARSEDGGTHHVDARVVVDATGQSTLLARKLGLKQVDPRLRKASIYTHFENGLRDPGVDEGATLILHTGDGQAWFWYIPLPGNRVSIGVVGSVDHLIRQRSAGPQEVFEEELAKCPELQRRLAPARQVRQIQVAKDFSYRARRVAGDGWVMVGDAFGFLDPIYSSGVFLALESGELAADAIVAGLRTGDLSAAQLGRYEAELVAGMEAIKRLIHAFYEPEFSFSKFLERHPECRQEVVDLLVGNVFRKPPSRRLFEALDEMCDEEAVPVRERDA